MNNNIHESPVRASRSEVILKNLSSSSAKRRRERLTHCQYCTEDVTRATFRDHLEESVACRILYFRATHLKHIEAVALSIYNCLFCDEKFGRIHSHLDKKETCLVQFKHLFNVDDKEGVLKRINNMKKEGYKSRRDLSRAMENASAKKKKRMKESQEPLEIYLNQHIQQTSSGNTKMCLNCCSFVTSAVEVHQDGEQISSKLYSVKDLEDKSKKRHQKFWLCHYCSQAKLQVQEDIVRVNGFKLSSHSSGNKTTFYWSSEEINHNDETDNSQSRPFIPELNVNNQSVLFPCSVAATTSLERNQKLNSLSKFQLQRLLYSHGSLTLEILCNLYQNQMLKYKRILAFGDLFSGKIHDGDNRLLSQVKPCINEKEIRGSNSWRITNHEEMKARFEQFGQHALFVSFDLPFDDSIAATKKVQEGEVVTVSYCGNQSQEMQRKFSVHVSHDSSEDCTSNCVKIDLDQAIESSDLTLSTSNISSYVVAADIFFTSMVKNIFKSPAFKLEAAQYQLLTQFLPSGLMRVFGVVWPLKFYQFNMIKISNFTEEEKAKIKEDFIDLIKSTLTKTSSAAVLKSKFNIPEEEGTKLVTAVKRHQIHLCKESSCESCETCQLPSLQTELSWKPTEGTISLTCQHLKEYFTQKFKALSIRDINEKSTDQWISELNEEIQVEQAGEYLIIIVDETRLPLMIDRRLSNLLDRYEAFKAMYQYVISSSDNDETLLFEQQMIVDAYTRVYSPFVLRAVGGSVEVVPVSNCAALSSHFEPSYEWGTINHRLKDHRNVTVTEAVVLSDSGKLNVKSSSTVEFIYPQRDPKKLFRKVHGRTETSFQLVGDERNHYELLKTAVDKYLNRINAKEMLLVEFVVFYDPVSKDEGVNLFNVYSSPQNIGRIEMTEEKSVTKVEGYPELIICSCGSAMKRRKFPKVMRTVQLEESSDDFKYSQVVLFTKVDASNDIYDNAFIENAFDEKSEDGERFVDLNRRMFLEKMRKYAYCANIED